MDDSSLVPFQRQAISSGVYEKEIEDLLWDNLEELTGENLFRVARQPTLPSLGRPDVLALDKQGRIVVIEVKRDVDRGQLAQALEYAGWARNVGLDEMASRYHGGAASFWEDWLEFTETATPTLVLRQPQLMLVARNFEPKTAQALEFLLDNKLPVKLLKVAFYADEDGHRFLNVEWENEPETALLPGAPASISTPSAGIATDFLEVTLGEVAKAVGAPKDLVWVRPKKGEQYDAVLLADGHIELPNGSTFRSPSGAARAAAQVVSYDGWYAWRVGQAGPTLNDIRLQIATAPDLEEESTASSSNDGGELYPVTTVGEFAGIGDALDDGVAQSVSD
jgi:hypothetical protein